jgi:hypothetical protein
VTPTAPDAGGSVTTAGVHGSSADAASASSVLKSIPATAAEVPPFKSALRLTAREPAVGVDGVEEATASPSSAMMDRLKASSRAHDDPTGGR